MQEVLIHLREIADEAFWWLGPVLLILLVGRLVISLVMRVTESLMRRSRFDETLVLFLSRILYFAFMIFVGLAAFDKLGVDTTSAVAAVGAAGLAIGLAFKDALSNLASGILLIIFRPFNVGDFVEVGGQTGKVRHIDVFSTGLMSTDNKWIVIPNSQISGKPITNYNHMPTRRVDITINVSYGDDIRCAKKIIQDLLNESDYVLRDPEPIIAVSELGDNGMILVVRPWVNTPNYWKFKFWFLETVKERFDGEGISIPYPQRDVHLKQSV